MNGNGYCNIVSLLCAAVCACDLRYSSSKDNSFHRFPVQGKSGHYKTVVTCLYCEGFAVSSSRKKSHRRIATKKGKCLQFVESSLMGDIFYPFRAKLSLISFLMFWFAMVRVSLVLDRLSWFKATPPISQASKFRL